MKKDFLLQVMLSFMISFTLSACGSMSVGREAGEDINIPTTMPIEINEGKLHGMNEPVPVCDVVLTVIEMTRKENIAEGQDLLVITLNLENQSGAQVPINAFDFTLVDSTNNTHTDAMAQVEQPLGSPRLEDGNSVSGMVTYRVPAGESNVKLIWQPGWCTGVAYVTLD